MTPVIFGEVLYDCFEDGSRVLGGAPFNVAWHLAAFGQQPQMISGVGEDVAGVEIRRRMTSWHMNQAGIQTVAQYPTGLVQIQLQQGEPSYEIVKPVAWDVIDASQLPASVHAAPLLYHGTLALRSETSLRALQKLKLQSSAPLFVDVNLRDPWWQREQVMQWLVDAHWIKLNQHELADLLPTVSSEAEAVQALFHASQVNFILLTKGEAGAVLFHRDGRQWQIKPAANLTMVDAVGAGDAFTSIFLLGILLKWPEQKTLQCAQEFASAIIGLHGATTDDETFYQRFRHNWSI